MKLLIIFFIISESCILFSCKEHINLTDNEMKLCSNKHFDLKLAEIVKKETGFDLYEIPIYNNEKYVGICSKYNNVEYYKFIRRYKKMFRQNGFLLFSYTDFNNQNFIGILKGTKEMDIIKWKNISTEDWNNIDIISKIEKWQNKYNIILIGIGDNWIELEFVSSNPNLDLFIKEISEFCPNLMEDGKDLSDLKEEIKILQGITLWWD